MGWSSGTGLFGSVIESLKSNIKDKNTRKEIYRDLIDAFQDHDWDNLDECLGEDPAYDEIYEEIYPDHDEESEEE